MSLICPLCAEPGLDRATAIELRAPGIWQELQLQIVECPSCAFKGGAVYLESRAGRLDSEVVVHSAYRLEPEEVAEIESRIAACPSRLDKRCGCEVHSGLLTDYAFGEPGHAPGFRGNPRRMPIGWDGKP